MKHLTILILFILITSSCSKEETVVSYAGSITELRKTINQNTPEQEPTIQEYTIEVAFILEDNKLKRQTIEGNIYCEGDYTLTNSKFEFSTDDCGCWCDCLPNIDCGGDILMGEYEAEMVDGNLVLFSEGSFDSNSSIFTTKITKTGTFVPQ